MDGEKKEIWITEGRIACIKENETAKNFFKDECNFYEHKLRNKIWYTAPLVSSLIGSTIDTFLFFSISFYGTGISWVTLSFGDLFVKIFVALTMLIPFRILLSHIQENTTIEKKINV